MQKPKCSILSATISNTFWTNTRITNIRSHAPSTSTYTHLNAAGASVPPLSVTQAQINHINLEALIGGYDAAAQALATTESLYPKFSTLINAASPTEIAVLDSSTTALAYAIYSIKLSPGDVIVSASGSEYAANAIAALHHSHKHGAKVVFVPSLSTGGVDFQQLRSELGKYGARVKAVLLTHCPTNGGIINDAQGVGDLIHQIEEGDRPIYFLDACQTVGQVHIDVQLLRCDVLATTSRKWLRGPRGVGFLYVKTSLLNGENMRFEKVPPILDMHGAKWGGGEGAWTLQNSKSERIAGATSFGKPTSVESVVLPLR